MKSQEQGTNSCKYNKIRKEEMKMNNNNQEREIIVDTTTIKKELIKLTIIRHTGKEPNPTLINKFLKYLNMEYENNTSKNNIENRISSLCRTIETKYDKYTRISQL